MLLISAASRKNVRSGLVVQHDPFWGHMLAFLMEVKLILIIILILHNHNKIFYFCDGFLVIALLFFLVLGTLVCKATQISISIESDLGTVNLFPLHIVCL
jgi:hypothetical protein